LADAKESDLTGCTEEVPLLGVTREFDFGQFIELYDDSSDPNDPKNTPTISRIVIQPNSELAAGRNAVTGEPPPIKVSSSAISVASTVNTPQNNGHQVPFILETSGGASSRSAKEPEVHLFDLAQYGPAIKNGPIDVQIVDADRFLENGTFEMRGRTYKVNLEEASMDAIVKGMAVTTIASSGKASSSTVPVRLFLSSEPVNMTGGQLAKVLSGQPVESSIGEVLPALTTSAIRTLLSGGTVLTHGVASDGRKRPLTLHVPDSNAEPLTDHFEVFDVASFLTSPTVMSKGGKHLPLKLMPEQVNQLISSGHTRLELAGRSIDFTVVKDHQESSIRGVSSFKEDLKKKTLPQGVRIPGMSLDEMVAYGKQFEKYEFVHPYQPNKYNGIASEAPSDGSASGAGLHSMTEKVQPRLPSGSGLPVAVFVPWKQTWMLKGFSRGNLLQTIAMAPQEQITMQVLSWERRSRSLDQSSETEVDQQTDVTQTTRDTEDVFKEMISKHDFAWQISGSIDASYSPGVASIQVHSGGGVTDTSNIVQTARRSSQSVKESTVKASSRVRSRRVTRITQTVESGREERVTRVIRNPNQCHTLTLDFFETLAHYEIKLEFLKDRLRLVVLVPNPINVPDFLSEIIRRNETALRNALIDTALVDGFEASRLVAAYEEAKMLLALQISEAAKVNEVETQRDKPSPSGSPDPAAPQQTELERVVGEMISILKNMKDAEIDTALLAIAAHAGVPETARRKGQQWLFINFCNAKLPALLSTLDDITKGNIAPVVAAQKMVAVLPKPDAPTNLGNLNQMSNAEKETACITSKLREETNQERLYMKRDWDWGWWSGRMQEEGLYTANDGGLAGLADQLQKAYAAWEAKKAQGDAMKDQEVAKTEAEGKQEKASTDDKLAMAFPLEDLARAYERMKTLMSHLNEHRAFYNYALFQALPPSEQTVRIVEASNGRLQVGLFEPRVVAMSGNKLVVPLTPLANTTQLQTFVTSLANDLENAFKTTLTTPDTTVLPTPGVSVSSRLGKCSACEDYIEKAREHELKRLEGLARQEQAEADRRKARLEKNDFDDFRQAPPAIKLDLDKT